MGIADPHRRGLLTSQTRIKYSDVGQAVIIQFGFGRIIKKARHPQFVSNATRACADWD
jgi:hypothetical protein